MSFPFCATFGFFSCAFFTFFSLCHLVLFSPFFLLDCSLFASQVQASMLKIHILPCLLNFYAFDLPFKVDNFQPSVPVSCSHKKTVSTGMTGWEMLRHTCKCACILSSILYESVTITWRHVYAWLTFKDNYHVNINDFIHLYTTTVIPHLKSILWK